MSLAPPTVYDLADVPGLCAACISEIYQIWVCSEAEQAAVLPFYGLHAWRRLPCSLHCHTAMTVFTCTQTM